MSLVGRRQRPLTATAPGAGAGTTADTSPRAPRRAGKWEGAAGGGGPPEAARLAPPAEAEHCPQRPPRDGRAGHTRPRPRGRWQTAGRAEPLRRGPGAAWWVPPESRVGSLCLPPPPPRRPGLWKTPQGTVSLGGVGPRWGPGRLPETLTGHTVNAPQGARPLGHRGSQDIPSRFPAPLKPPLLVAFNWDPPFARGARTPRPAPCVFITPAPSGARAGRASLRSPGPLCASRGAHWRRPVSKRLGRV